MKKVNLCAFTVYIAKLSSHLCLLYNIWIVLRFNAYLSEV